MLLIREKMRENRGITIKNIEKRQKVQIRGTEAQC